MSMKWGHWLFLAAIFFVGFIVAKKWPNLFSGVPLVGQYL